MSTKNKKTSAKAQSNTVEQSRYIAELEPFDATMHAYYYVSALKNIINRHSATETMEQLTECELVRIFDTIMFQVMQIGRALDAKENTHDFFDMVYDDRTLPDIPGSVARA